MRKAGRQEGRKGRETECVTHKITLEAKRVIAS
jgi:hypothetical protein